MKSLTPADPTPTRNLCREWFFVKRALDRRSFIVVSGRGETRFHQVAVENLAELVAVAADQPGTRFLNAADERPYVRRDRTGDRRGVGPRVG